MTSTIQTTSEALAGDVAALEDVWSGGVDDPYPLYAELRRRGPVYEGDVLEQWGLPSSAGDRSGRRFFTVLGYADVMAVLRDGRTFTSGVHYRGALGSLFDDRMMVLALDGDEHRTARGLLQEAFSSQSIQKWRTSFIEPLVMDEFITPLLPRLHCDLLEDFAAAYPVRSVYRIIGMPDDPDAYRQFVLWGLRMLAAPSSDPAARESALQASKDMFDHLCHVLARRRLAGQIRGDDLISRLFSAVHEGRQLTDREIAGFLRTILPASAESTTRTFCNLMTLLLQNPAVLAELRSDRSMLPNAVEEAVRLEPVISVITREVQEDVEIAGIKIPRGSIISAATAAAGRDGTVFERPNEFDLHRPRKPALGWGFGPHMCLGMQVARAEIEAAVEAILDHMPRLRLDPDYPAPKLRGAMLRSPASVHVRWD